MATSSSKVLITAALPYANGSIHIGHLLEYIQADIYARFLKLQGKDCLYICASDMHGTPIEINAAKAGKPPEEFVEQFWREHQQDFASYGIEFDEYYKTHSSENKELAEFFFQKLKDKKLIYRKTIKAVYCEQCRRYLPDRFVKGTCPHCKAEEQYGDVCEKCSSILKGIDLLTPHCSICGKTPIQKDSEHYFFRLSLFSQKLRTWIFAKKSNLQPEVRNWLKEWLDKGLEDWCVSRDAPYFGFEIPDSKKETGENKYFYVWLDAPIGYISSTKHYCDARKQKWEAYWKKGNVQHFIGKDIAYFHFLFWPAMLLAVGIPLPSLTVHGFITVSGQKMSKSRGTFFTAKDFLKLYPAEALRFYYGSHLDRSVVDVDLNFDDFIAVNNNVLVGSIGNFCYRVLTFAQKNYGTIKDIASEKKLSQEVLGLVKGVEKHYAAQDFRSAVKCIQQIADIGNAYFQKAEPWVGKEKKEKQVAWCVQVARILGIICSPLLPTFGGKIALAFGDKPRWKNIGFGWKGTIQPVEHLVEKIEKKEQQLFPLHLAVGKVTDVKDHPNADSLFLLKIDFGSSGIKQSVTSLKKFLPRAAFLNKKIIFCLNLKPAKFRGELSEAMILAAEHGTTIVPLEMKKAAVGSLVAPEGMQANTQEIGFEEVGKVKMAVLGGKVVVGGKVLRSPEEVVDVPGVPDGTVVR